MAGHADRRGPVAAPDHYRSAANAIDANGGIIDKFQGDGVMALFIPVIAGENHALRAILAGRAILAAVEQDGLAGKGLLVGVGLHSGEAFVGVVGSGEKLDSVRSATRSTSRPVWVGWQEQASCS